MNKEEQYLLFALSAPMEILNQGCKPAHDSPKMYTGIKEFDLSSSWGINNRDDLIQTIYQMTDDGHANDLAGLYLTWHRSSPEEWKALIAGGSERGLIYTQFVAWICPYISRHLLSLNPLQARCRRYSRGER